MEEIVYGMRSIVAHLKETQETEEKVSDWHHAAAVLDVAFFWLTAITILGSTLAFYFMIPNWPHEVSTHGLLLKANEAGRKPNTVKPHLNGEKLS